MLNVRSSGAKLKMAILVENGVVLNTIVHRLHPTVNSAENAADRGNVSLPHDACRYQSMNAWHTLAL